MEIWKFARTPGIQRGLKWQTTMSLCQHEGWWWRCVQKKKKRHANTGKQANKDDWRELSFLRSYTKMHTNKSSYKTVKQICNWKTKTMSFISAGILEDPFSWLGLNRSRQDVSLSDVSGSNWRSSEMACGVSHTCYTRCHAETQRSECELTYHRPQRALAVTAATCCCKSCT